MLDDSLNPSYKIPWPEQSDKLFSSAGDWWHNACLNWAHDDWELYISGYREAANVLVGHVENNRRGQDIIVYPTVFLYRQYLELRLKKLIRDGKVLLDEPSTYPKHHRLDELWRECRSVLMRVWPKEAREELKAVDEMITQFCAIDSDSLAFRYPTTRQNKKSLPDDLQYINFRNLYDVMEKMANFLEASAMGVSAYLDYKDELE